MCHRVTRHQHACTPHRQRFYWCPIYAVWIRIYTARKCESNLAKAVSNLPHPPQSEDADPYQVQYALGPHSPTPKEHFCTAHPAQFSLLPFLRGRGRDSNLTQCFFNYFGTSRVSIPNGTSIRTAVFASAEREWYWQTHHATGLSVTIGRISCIRRDQIMWTQALTHATWVGAKVEERNVLVNLVCLSCFIHVHAIIRATGARIGAIIRRLGLVNAKDYMLGVNSDTHYDNRLHREQLALLHNNITKLQNLVEVNSSEIVRVYVRVRARVMLAWETSWL